MPITFVFPFCETRAITELLAFHTEERRASIAHGTSSTFSGRRSGIHPHGPSRWSVALFWTRSGYYALPRPDLTARVSPKERQLEFLRRHLRLALWEHIPLLPAAKDKTASIFKALRGWRLPRDHPPPEYNT